MYLKRKFVQTKRFAKDWENLNLTDDDLSVLEYMLLENTKLGKVIKGTKGLRKLRFRLNSKGSRGGARICYVDFESKETIVFINAYAKNIKEDLTDEEKKSINVAIAFLEKNII